VLTAPSRQTHIVGARVTVVAHKLPLAHTGPADALVTGGARRAVVTVVLVGREHAASARVTAVVGAGIAIVTQERAVAPLAVTVEAMVPQRAHVTVVARERMRHVHTAFERLTQVMRTGVAVVAWSALGSHARAQDTGVTGGTSVGVVTASLVGLEQAAL